MGALNDAANGLYGKAREGVDALENKAIDVAGVRAAAPIPPPSAPPDLTDVDLQRARQAAMRRLLMGDSLSSSFLTGPLGDTSAVPKSVAALTAGA